MEIQVLQKKENALLALTNAEQSLDTPKPVVSPKSVFNATINSIRKSKEKPLLAPTDAKPSLNIRTLLFDKENKNDSYALLRRLIKSTKIPKAEKEQVLLALTNDAHSSNKIINTIEKHLGHKVSDIIFCSHNLPRHHHLHNLHQVQKNPLKRLNK